MKKDITNRLQTDDKFVKKTEKTPRKIDKTFVILVAIALLIAIFVVLFVTFIEPVRAAMKLSAAENFFEGENVSVVVINSAAKTEGLLGDKEMILRDAEANIFADRIYRLLNNVKYSDTNTVNIGVWKTKIVLYNSTEQLELYVDNDGIYLENRGKLICYNFDGEGNSEYSSLLSDIEKLLK